MFKNVYSKHNSVLMFTQYSYKTVSVSFTQSNSRSFIVFFFLLSKIWEKTILHCDLKDPSKFGR